MRPSIRYTDDLDGITAASLSGFFVGWPRRPSEERHLALLKGSYRAVLAVEEDAGRVVDSSAQSATAFSVPTSPCSRCSPSTGVRGSAAS
jgi:hypothetical protein